MTSRISSNSSTNAYYAQMQEQRQLQQEQQRQQMGGESSSCASSFASGLPSSSTSSSAATGGLNTGTASMHQLAEGLIALVEVLAKNPQIAQELGSALSHLGSSAQGSEGSPSATAGPSTSGMPSTAAGPMSSTAAGPMASTATTSPGSTDCMPTSPGGPGASPSTTGPGGVPSMATTSPGTSPPNSSLKFGSASLNQAAFAAPATYNAATHNYVAEHTPNYAQLSSTVSGYLNTLTGSGNTLTPEQHQEMVDSAIDCAQRFLPNTLPMNERCAMILTDIGAESSWRVTGNKTPNGPYGFSEGVQSVTTGIQPEQYKQAGGPQNFDINSIWGNMHLANWAIASIGQARGQTPDNPGNKAASWYTGLYYYVGSPQVGANQPLPSTIPYRDSQAQMLEKLGLNPSIFDAGWTS